MKKIIALVLSLFCVMNIIGCASTTSVGIPQVPSENKTNVDTSKTPIENKTNIDMPQTPNENNRNNEKPNQWGIIMEVDNVTENGLTIVCNHSGGENAAQLNTGSYYVLQKLVKTEWVDVEYLPQEYEVAWTSEAWIIQKESTTQWDVNWEWLYGKLSAGEYRIGKEIMNFRGTGDYDTEMVYAVFIIN